MRILPSSSKESIKSQKNSRTSIDASQAKEIAQNRRSLALSSSTELFSSNPSEIERQARRSRLQSIRRKRTSNHIFSFIRVYAQINDRCFPVTSSRTNTIDDLARQIEAEYAFNYSCSPSEDVLSGYDSEEEFTKMELLNHFEEYADVGDNETSLVPLMCGSLFVDQVELRFSDIVGEVLNLNDVVRVVNVYEAPAHNTPSTEKKSRHEKKRWSFPSIKKGLRNRKSLYSRVQSITDFNISNNQYESPKLAEKHLGASWNDGFSSMLDERFQGVLSHKTELSQFKGFCLKEYAIENLLFWMEVEFFRDAIPSLVSNVAQYIYQTYIANNSPLQVNLCEEILSEIPSSFSSDTWTPNITIFDEAQEYVYEMLMHHTFQRFEEANACGTTPEQCQDDIGLVNNPTEHQLPNEQKPDVQLMNSVIADIQSNFENKGNDWFKEEILKRILQHHFPESSPPERSYFSDGRKLTLAQKRRKMRLEKKLSKFFGQKLTEEELIQQQIHEVMNSPRRNSSISTLSLPSDISSPFNPGKQKKLGKLEKLECFFGKRLTNAQLEYQNLINRKSMCLPPECPECKRTPLESALPISTYNDLSLEERRVLTKRSRKLKCLLGEPIDEQTAFKSLTYPVINRRLSFDSDTLLSPESVDNELLPDSCTWHQKSSKEAKRKKLVKLYQLLGTYPTEDEFNTKSLIQRKESLLDRNGKPLAPEIKRIHLKKASKLERVFGQHPPKDLIVDQGNEALPEQNTSILSLLVNQDVSMDNLIEYLQVLALLNDSDLSLTEDEQEPGELRSHSAPSSFKFGQEPPADDKPLEGPSREKATRQRKLAKLRRFFGNDLRLESLIAQNILLQHQLATEGLYSLNDSSENLSNQSLEDFDLIDKEALIHTAMKYDLELLHRGVQAIHRQSSSTSTIDAI
ncbi:hypothetical protein K7432_003569 [Basidiobolus ranarum]|uniref:RGS domain-containing protein n=1 Tax=Basidiobolus ranarum TaxID=34480 RepID=A0ABR2W5Z1_9FUNG